MVSALKDAVDVPIHLHTHDTTGNGIATYVQAVNAGVDIVDVAQSAFSGTTSQPSMDLCITPWLTTIVSQKSISITRKS